MQEQNEHYFMMNTLINPSAVSHSIVAQLALNEKHLIVSKMNLLELYGIDSTGLIPLTTKRYSTSITLLLKYKPNRDVTDYIIVLTQSNEIEILKLTPSALHVISSGSLKDNFGRKSFFGVKAALSPDNQVLLLNLYEQLIKIVNLPQHPKDQLAASNTKINQSHVLDMCFCLFNDSVQLSILHENKRDIRHIDSYILNHFNELEKGTFKQPNVGITTSRIIGFLEGIVGIFVISDETACYFNGNGKHVLINLYQYPNTSSSFLTKDTLLLADSNRLAIILEFNVNIQNEIIEIKCKPLTKQLYSIVSTISVLNENVLFIGSLNGDSVIMNLEGNILEKWKNVGSLMDAKQIDGREEYLVVGNGGGKGSVGMMMKGSGIEELGSYTLEGIQTIESFDFEGKKYVMVGMEEESKIWEIEKNFKSFNVRDSQILKLDKKKVISFGINQNRIIFICSKEIICINNKGKKKSIYKCNDQITHAKFYKKEGYFVTANSLFKLNEDLKVKELCALKENVSSIDVKDYIVLGLWNGSVCIMGMDGNVKKEIALDGIVSRSIIIDNNKLYIGCNGCVKAVSIDGMEEENGVNEINYQIETSNFFKIRKIYSTPCIVSSKSFTLQSTGLIPLAVEDLIDICESPIGINGVICATTRGILFGSMEPMSRVTFKMIFSGENCCKIATNGEHGLLVGKTIKSVDLKTGKITNATVDLQNNEIGLCVDTLEDNIYAIGTAIIKENEVEPSSGRIILIREDSEGLIYPIGTKDYEGAVYCLKKYQKGIVAFINRNLHVIEKKGNELTTKQSTLLPLIGVNLEVVGDYIIVGDLMRSISVYQYRSDLEHLDVVGKDVEISWSNCVGSNESEKGIHFMIADVYGNIQIFDKIIDETKNEEEKLNKVSQIHIGDSFNFMKKSFYKGTILGGISGGVFNICEISKQHFDILIQIQNVLVKKNWRESVGKERIAPLFNCIDGDRIESILEWNDKKQLMLANKIGLTQNELIDTIKLVFNQIFN